MTDRYAALFDRLAARREGAFIPFVMLGHPTPAASAAVLGALIDAGADALELGLPFSDPVADGPVIQAAAVEALAAGTRVADCWRLVEGARARAPSLPIGLLVYGNLVTRPGIDRFYGAAAAAGVDSVLVADVPLDESAPFVAAAGRSGIAPVFIAPPNATPDRLARVAAASRGYTYVTTRGGVTGEDDRGYPDLGQRMAALRALGAAPPVLGFGVSGPAQVRGALAAGAAGVIVGSAIVRRVTERPAARPVDDALVDFLRSLKRATVAADEALTEY
jgi:tryptophan synthase alpha chain